MSINLLKSNTPDNFDSVWAPSSLLTSFNASTLNYHVYCNLHRSGFESGFFSFDQVIIAGLEKRSLIVAGYQNRPWSRSQVLISGHQWRIFAATTSHTNPTVDSSSPSRGERNGWVMGINIKILRKFSAWWGLHDSSRNYVFINILLSVSPRYQWSSWAERERGQT